MRLGGFTCKEVKAVGYSAKELKAYYLLLSTYYLLLTAYYL